MMTRSRAHLCNLLTIILHLYSVVGFQQTRQQPTTTRRRQQQHFTHIGGRRHASSSVTEEIQVDLGTGICMQVLYRNPNNKKTTKTKPPLLFIHGSFHAAWCWSEHYFDYFVDKGYPVAALSLRGTSGSYAGEGVKKVLIEEHVSDLKSLLDSPQLSEIFNKNNRNNNHVPPVLIAHSFGGLTVMKYLEEEENIDRSKIAGIVTMCSVPPSGNGPMTLRFLQKSLRNSWLITVGFVLKRCIPKEDVARELFFGGPKVQNVDDGTTEEDYGISDEDVRRYQSYFQRDTEAIIDVSALLKSLPSLKGVVKDEDGDNKKMRAPLLEQFPPCLVIGASRDFIVDAQGVEETAHFFGLPEPVLVDSPHDVMLGRNWQKGAEAIHNFLVSKVNVS